MAEAGLIQQLEAPPLRLASRVEVADTLPARLAGLIGRSLGEEEGLYLSPCSSVHTFGMGGPIDVVFLDEEGRALSLYHALPPWRATRWVRGARGALELPAGTLARRGLRQGQRVEMEGWAPGAAGRPLGRWGADLLLGAFWFLLAVSLVPLLARGEGSPSAFMLFAVNTVIAILFWTRREKKRVTDSARDRLITLVCILLSFSLRPAAGASVLPGAWASGLMTASLALVLAAYFSLGRSFGLIPADRGLKVGGLYAWARHPLYGAEMLFFASFLLANFTARNALLSAGLFLSLHLRALAEERLLGQDEAYRAYCRRVRARYFPKLV